MESIQKTHPEEEAIVSEKKLESMHSLFGKLFRPGRAIEEDVRSQLLCTLQVVRQDKTGESALRFICALTPEKIMKVHHVNVKNIYNTLDKDVEFTPSPLATLDPQQCAMYHIPAQVPTFFCSQTAGNKEKAMLIIERIINSAKESEIKNGGGGIHNIS